LEVLPVNGRLPLFLVLSASLLVLGARPASATFHLMQIEQVIGGVDGDATKQAIQLRYRSSFQNLLSNARLNVRDAAGANPVLLIDFTSNSAVTANATRILCATSNFGSSLSPAVTADYQLTNPIPVSYLAAGSLTFEDDIGTIYWRVSWGGASYTGPKTGSITNDSDGQFGVWPSELPSSTNQALLFQGTAAAASTLNQNDYAVTAGGAQFENDDGSKGTVQTLVGTPGAGVVASIALGAPAPNPTRRSMSYSVVLPHRARANVGIFDVSGRRILTLVDRELDAGPHAFSWVGPSDGPVAMSNGVYFLGLEAEGSFVARRFVLMR
jgi:hypothetical protein